MNVVLWCNFRGVSFKMDLAVYLLLSDSLSLMVSMPSVNTFPATTIKQSQLTREIDTQCVSDTLCVRNLFESTLIFCS